MLHRAFLHATSHSQTFHHQRIVPYQAGLDHQAHAPNISIPRQSFHHQHKLLHQPLFVIPRSPCTHHIRKARRAGIRVQTGPSDVFVLDFDGVLLDSEPEISHSALECAKLFWHDHSTPYDDETLLKWMRECRPVLVNGFEAVIMAKLLLQQGEKGKDRILGNNPPWEQLWPALLKEWHVLEEAIAQQFETLRLAEAHQDSKWTDMQKVYPGVLSALKTTDFPIYFASSKAPYRISQLLESKFGLDIPVDSPRLYGSLIPPNERKLQALCAIAERPVCQEAHLHFIDDREESLAFLAQQPQANPWRLYFASWGYSTPEEKEAARKLAPRVQYLELEQFTEFLKWGLVMGVDDGCQEQADDLIQGEVKGYNG